MTDTISTTRNAKTKRASTKLASALLALTMGAAALPTSAFAASGDFDNGRGFGHHREYRTPYRAYRYAPPPPPAPVYRAKRHYGGGHHGHHGHGGNDAGAAIAGAIIGLAIGAMIADSNNRQPAYAPPSQTYYGPMPGAQYDYAPEPFTDDWYAYCASKYRTFDPDTGTFQPNNGPRRLCQ